MIDYDDLLADRNALKTANDDLRLRLSAIYSIAETIKEHINVGQGNITRIDHILSLASARASNAQDVRGTTTSDRSQVRKT